VLGVEHSPRTNVYVLTVHCGVQPFVRCAARARILLKPYHHFVLIIHDSILGPDALPLRMILVRGKYRYILKDILLVGLMTSVSSSYVFWHASRSLVSILSIQCADLLCFVPLPWKFGILERRLPQLSKSSLRSCRNHFYGIWRNSPIFEARCLRTHHRFLGFPPYRRKFIALFTIVHILHFTFGCCVHLQLFAVQQAWFVFFCFGKFSREHLP
jgi:hypothetical protein